MKRRQVWIVGLGLVALVAAAVAWLESKKVNQLRFTMKALAAQKAHLDRQGVTDARRNDWLRRQRSELQIKVDKLKAAHPAAARAGNQLPDRKTMMAVYNDPQLQNLYLSAFRARLVLQYGSFYRKAGLSADQIAKFEELQTESNAQLLDIARAGEALGLNDKSKDVALLTAQSNAQLKADEIALLGQAGYAQLQEYVRAAPQRELVNSLAANLLFTSLPLSSQQADQLTQVLAATQTGANGIDYDEVKTRAATFLAPAQVAELSSRIADMRHRELMLQVKDMIEAWERDAQSGGTP